MGDLVKKKVNFTESIPTSLFWTVFMGDLVKKKVNFTESGREKKKKKI